MPAKLRLNLLEEERNQLIRWTKNPPKPFLRRRAWAILLIADGKAAYQVAEDPRVHAHRTTVCAWVCRYRQESLQGLKQKPGQGRKAAFFPSDKGRSQKSA